MIDGSGILDDNSYIASEVKVMNQRPIENSSFVGMGTVVTKDVEPNIPAKIIRKRKKIDSE